MKLTTFIAILVVAFLAALAAVAAPTTYVLTTGGSNREVPACGASPCTLLNVTSTVVLNANPRRFECLLQNTGLVPIFCVRSTPTTTRDFILKAATATSTGDGLSYSCNQGPGVYTGAISCRSATTSTASSLDVSAVGF